MRTLLLSLMFISFAGAAEMERITTTDGRVLEGVYDEVSETLRMKVGKIDGQIPLKVIQIAMRAPLTPPPPERNFILEAATLERQQKEAEAQRVAAEEQRAADRIAYLQAQEELRAEAQRKAIARKAEEDEADEAERLRQERAREAAEAAAIAPAQRPLAPRAAPRERTVRAPVVPPQRLAPRAHEPAPAIAAANPVTQSSATMPQEPEAIVVRSEASRIYMIVSVGLFIWLFPVAIAFHRKMRRKWDVVLMCVITAVAAAATGLIGFPLTVIGMCVAAAGWLAALAWALFAGSPRNITAR